VVLQAGGLVELGHPAIVDDLLRQQSGLAGGNVRHQVRGVVHLSVAIRRDQLKGGGDLGSELPVELDLEVVPRGALELVVDVLALVPPSRVALIALEHPWEVRLLARPPVAVPEGIVHGLVVRRDVIGRESIDGAPKAIVRGVVG